MIHRYLSDLALDNLIFFGFFRCFPCTIKFFTEFKFIQKASNQLVVYGSAYNALSDWNHIPRMYDCWGKDNPNSNPVAAASKKGFLVKLLRTHMITELT